MMKFRHLILSIILLSITHVYAQSNVVPEVESVVAIDDSEEGDTIEFTESLLRKSEVSSALDSIRSKYPDEWSELSMEGKLSFEGLPVRPTVKIYMKRGESVVLSARAPIFGEVARVEMSEDSVTFINKHSRKYMSVNLQRYSRMCPGIMADIQDIFLGYVAYPGHGRLTEQLADMSDWIDAEDDVILLMPRAELQYPDMQYGFILDSQDYGVSDVVMELIKTEMIIEMSYIYGDSGWTLTFEAEKGNRPVGGELQLSYPDYAPAPLQFTKVGDKYQRTDLRGLLKF